MVEKSGVSLAVGEDPRPSLESDLVQEFAIGVNLLGGNVVETDVAGLGEVLAAELDVWSGSVGVSSDLAGLFPWLHERRRGDTTDASALAISRGRLGVAFSGRVLIAERTHGDR